MQRLALPLCCISLFLLIHASQDPLFHLPFTPQDHITPTSLFTRYPQIKALMKPQMIAMRFSQLSYSLKRELRIMSVTVLNREVTIKCYSTFNSCPYDREYRDRVIAYVRERPKVRNLYFLFILRDETHYRWIHQALEKDRVQEPERSMLYEKYFNIIEYTPMVMYSVDLANRLENKKILVPQSWMLFANQAGQFWTDVKAQALQGSKLHPWEQKINKIFWTGLDSGHTRDFVDFLSDIPRYFPRMELVRQAKEHPNIIDAGFTRYQEGAPVYRYQSMGLDIRSAPVSTQDHMKYKYLISLDGWTAAWFRPQMIMTSNSVFVKQQSEKVETWYYLMEPYKHYVPVKNDLSDLLEVYNYMETHQDDLQKIIKNANEFGERYFGQQISRKELFEIFDEYYSYQNSTTSAFESVFYGRPFEEILSNFNDNDRRIILGQKNERCQNIDRTPKKIEHSLMKYRKIGLMAFGVEVVYLFIRMLISILSENSEEPDNSSIQVQQQQEEQKQQIQD